MESLMFMLFAGFSLVWLLLMFILIAYGITAYVLGSLGMYQIAKRRGIHNPWLAWLPVGNAWILGSISDHYQYVTRGKERQYRKVLLWMQVGLLCISVIMSIVSTAISLSTTIGMAMGSELPVMAQAMGSMGVTIMLSLVSSLASIAVMVFWYICYYDVFRSCKPNNTVLFLILGIVLGIMPFFVFACRNSDEGMPPKIRNTAT